MKLVYICFGRAHSSVVSAAIHLGRLSTDRVPSLKELTGLKYFDRSESKDIAVPTFVGVDESGVQVFILGLNGHRVLGQTAIEGLRDVLGGSQYDVILVDTLGEINWICRIGGFLSRRLKWVGVGRPMVGVGIQRSFRRLAALVSGVKKELERIAQEESHLRH